MTQPDRRPVPCPDCSGVHRPTGKRANRLTCGCGYVGELLRVAAETSTTPRARVWVRAEVSDE